MKKKEKTKTLTMESLLWALSSDRLSNDLGTPTLLTDGQMRALIGPMKG